MSLAVDPGGIISWANDPEPTAGELAYDFVSGQVALLLAGASSSVTVVMDLVTSAQTVFSVTITPGSVTTVLPLVTGTMTVFNATVTPPPVTTVLPLVTSTQTVFDPTINIGATSVVMDLVTSAQTVFSATVTVGSVTAVLPLVTSTQTVFNTTITGGVIADGLLALNMENATMAWSETTLTGGALEFDYVSGSVALLMPPGYQQSSVVVPLVTNTSTVFTAKVSRAGWQDIVLPLVTNTQTLFGPTVTLSTISSMTETWTGTNGFAWPIQWVVFTNGAGTAVDIQSNKGHMATGTGVFGKVAARNTAAFLPANYVLMVDIVIPTLTEWYFYVHVRGAAGVVNTFKLATSYQMRFITSGGTVVAELYQVDASGGETLRATGGMSGTPVAGDTIHIMIEVSGSGTVTLKQKAWKDGTSEPAYTDLSSSLSVSNVGQYFLLSVQGGNNTTSEDFLWDDFSATALVQNVAMDLVTNTPTVFTPTVNAGILLPLVSNVPTVFDPAVLPKQTVTMAARVLNPPTVFTPTVQLVQTIVVPLVTRTPTVFNPTVTPASLTPVLPLVTNTPTVFSPAVSIGTKTVTAPLVYMTMDDIILDENDLPILDENNLPIRDGTAGVFAPAVVLRTINLPLVTNVPVVFSPAVATTSQTVVMTFIDAEPTVFDPVVNLIVTMDLVTGTPTVFDPSVGTGGLTMVLPLVASPQTVFAPSTINSQVTVLPLVTSTQTVFSATVRGSQTTVLPLVTSTQTVFDATVTLGSVTISMLRVVNPPTVFAPAVNPLVQIVEVEHLVNLMTVFALAVNPGTFLFLPPHDEGGPRKLSEYGRRRQGVSRAANDLAGRYGAPRSFSVLKINGAYQMIQGPTVRQTLDAEEYYAGGHEYEVDYNTAQALEAAGFDVQGF